MELSSRSLFRRLDSRRSNFWEFINEASKRVSFLYVKTIEGGEDGHGEGNRSGEGDSDQ